MCDQFTLHHKFRIDTGRTKFGQGKPDSILYGCDFFKKEYNDPYEIDLTKPRLASYKQKTWKRHQDTVYWVDTQLAQRKGYTRCDAIILYDITILSQLFVSRKLLVMESGDHLRESFCVTSAFSQDILERLSDERIGFRSCWRQ